MKQFILFPELTGSDSLLPLDGRLSHYSAIRQATESAARKKNVCGSITRGQLCRGTVLNPTIVREFPIVQA